VSACPVCGKDNREGAKFCDECAAPLASTSAPREARKTVTVVFCDVIGSTAMGERLDPESMRRAMSRYFEAMRSPLERHGGTVEKFIGDAVVAVFGVPQVHEDDALRAVRAAQEMRQALQDLNKELERDLGFGFAARIGVNTGEVVAGGASSDTLVTGDAVNVAARLEQAAQPGDILIGAETRRLVQNAVAAEPVPALELKGKADRTLAYRVLEVAMGTIGTVSRLDSPMVGRDRQLKQLRQAFDATVADNSCQLFTVLGTAGVGKSRLVGEFLGAIDVAATVLRGRCLPYGDGITFFPVGQVVKEATGLGDFDAPEEVERKICAILGEEDRPGACARLAQLFGIGASDGFTEETFWAVRRFLESVARRGPLVVVFDDIHWGEPTFLDLVEHITDWSRDAPILVICMARPELLDARPVWAGGKLNTATIKLEALTDAESDELIANLLEGSALPEEIRSRIVEAAEGTPLFVEEMLSMLIDDELLSRNDGGWVVTGELGSIPVPPNIQALLAARLDRLTPIERAAIERAAVAGKQFHLGAVSALFGSEERADVRAALMGLVRRDLIGPDRSSLAGDEAFRFRHMLIRDAAYSSIPKAARAALHERFAEWLLGVSGERVEEQEEVVGYHLEQAYLLRRHLRPLDETTRAIGMRAAEHLRASGQRASMRGDPVAAATLRRRAAALIEDGPERATVLFELGLALRSVGDRRGSFAASDEAAHVAAAAGDTSLEWQARLLRSDQQMRIDPHGKPTVEVRAELEYAMRVFESLGDEGALAWALLEQSEIEYHACQYEAAEYAALRAEVHARRAANGRYLLQAHWERIFAQMWGTTSPEEGLATLRAAKPDFAGNTSFKLLEMIVGGAYRGMLGDPDSTRREIARADEICGPLRLTERMAQGATILGRVELWAGEPAAAERAFSRAYQLFDSEGDEAAKSTAAAWLARALCRNARFAEAEDFARIAREVGAEDDLTTQAYARAAEAMALSATSRHDHAVRLARVAIEMFAHAQDPNSQAELRMDLAEVLRAAGDDAGSAKAAREAVRLYELKGNVLAATGVGSFLASLNPL
jgi:class 3 adenylate cyclase/tetratricopeptide (TPR) repeat protein